MLTTNSYVLRQMATPLVIAVVAALSFLLTGCMLRLLDPALSSSGSLRPMVQVPILLIAHYVTLALPNAIGQWPPLALLILVSARLFRRAAFTTPTPTAAPAFVARIDEFGRRTWSNFRRAGQEGR